MDDELSRLGHQMRAEVEAGVDVDAAWAARTVGGVSERPARSGPPRWTWMLAAAAVTIALVAAGVLVLVDQDDSLRTHDTVTTVVTVPAITDPVATTPPSTSPVPSTQVPSPIVPTEEPSTTTVAPPPAEPQTIAVSYLDLPAPATLVPFGSFTYATEAEADIQLSIGELGVVYAADGTVRSFGPDGSTETTPIGDLEPFSLVNGPGSVVYGLVLEPGPPYAFRMVAIALWGEHAGTVVARSELMDTATWAELPHSALGHGPDGIVSLVRPGGESLLAYVDEAGEPRTWTGAPAAVATIDQDHRVRAGDLVWQLGIERDPTWVGPLSGDNGVAPGPDGRFVYATTIGAPIDPSQDYPDTGVPVIAVLRADGSGEWLSLPEGWRYESSSPAGILVSRNDPATRTRELALVETSVPSAAGAAEYAGIERQCTDGNICTQLVVDPTGTIVGYDPISRMLTRHSVPPVTAQVPFDGDVRLVAAGPDGAVYLATPTSIEDPIGDLVAVSLTEGDAGREHRRLTGALDLSGDTDLVATPDGLVAVGCCGGEALRPAPDAPLVTAWVGPNDPSSSLPPLRFDTAGTVIGETSWPIDLDGFVGIRGMPELVATFDGGFLGAFADVDGSRVMIARGRPDGTVSQVELTEYPALLEPTGRVLFDDGDHFVRAALFDEPVAEPLPWGLTTDWSLTLAVNDQVDLERPAWAANPVAFANQFVSNDAVNETRSISIDGADDGSGDDVTATVVTANHFDDALAATRLTFRFTRTDSGLYHAVGGTYEIACQPGRGHEDFQPANCA